MAGYRNDRRGPSSSGNTSKGDNFFHGDQSNDKVGISRFRGPVYILRSAAPAVIKATKPERSTAGFQLVARSVLLALGSLVWCLSDGGVRHTRPATSTVYYVLFSV